MTTALLLDEMYPPALADALCGKGHDVVAVAASPELVGADDSTVLDAATTAQRCVVTENIRDFAMLARQTRHAGVLFVHPRRWPRSRNGVPRLVSALDQAIHQDTIPAADDTAWLT
ncbi:DUF5615 family PIN-like protein [Saccharomonospora halophila]|uniref:DUF5615 family PIN-like protein n=1 Tax=Saccharomonospora halophila TaxID=129922 RepID=UPI00036651A7|nr:DUF5615 family PIN-like protein [Saccharomonospora halophila]